MSAISLRKDADELLRLAMLTEVENVKRILTSEASRLVQAAEAEEKLSKVAPKKVVQIPQRTIKLQNYGWDQSDKFLKLYVTMEGVQNFPAADITATFGEKSVQLLIHDGRKESNYLLAINNLLYPVIQAESYHKVKSDMVILFLKKTSTNTWPCVTETEQKVKDLKTPKMDTQDEDPGANLMNLMKQMYQDGDDNMKRTIAQAWTEARDKKSSPDFL
ncbi:calcyclin-binding protein [Caerostris extrusa]|uniref:Calcyclin-binding protein n=1 Tax=Caerostris extrusa TaxID=172846 RepID=A0AAV4NBS8_CAEEX|nr:calcyclin-binding protein [Caerostris extrusa]